MSKRGKLIVLVAPSGGGKSTMTRRLLRDFPQIRFSVSATTRRPRAGETDGVSYHFISEEAFDEKVLAGSFLEWVEVYAGVRYGTLREDVENQLNKGYFVLLDVDVLGALKVLESLGETPLSVFLKPPSMSVLKERLILRGSESEKSLEQRLSRAEKEISMADKFGHVIVNDDLDVAYDELKSLVGAYMDEPA